MSSFLMSVAVILFASAWLASVTGWREATTTLGRWCVVTIVGWLLARRFPRFTDEGARGRRRRSVPRDGSGS